MTWIKNRGRATLFSGGVIHTGRTEAETFSHMLVQNGRVLALSNERPGAARYAREIPLCGQHAYPCLLDGHTHLLSTIILAAAGFDICGIESGGVEPHTLAGVREKLTAFAAAKPRNALVVANQYILSAIDERRLPSREELDAWAGGRAVCIYTIDGHASAMSSAMLKKLHIDPAGHSGILTGEAHERVQGQVTDLIGASVTPKILAQGIAKFENRCAAYGISCVGALEGNGDSPKDPMTGLLVMLARRMRIRVRVYLQYIALKRVEKKRRLLQHARIGGCGDWEMDGAVGAHSAAFAMPYRDTGEVAPCYYEQEAVDAIVREADEKGYQIACHAIGEQAIERIVRAFDGTASGRLHRLEHGEFPNEETLRRICRGRYAVMVQPGYSWIDKRYLHTYEQYLQPAVIDRLRLRTMFDAGVCVCGSSDSPVQELNPYLQMTGMVAFYRPDESVTPYQAFCSYTKNAARALYEDDAGTLECGKRADFFLADQDFFRLTAQQILSFRPTACYYGGRRWKERRGTVGELAALLLRPPHKV